MFKKYLWSVVIVVALSIVPSTAKAIVSSGFFNDGRWYMDSSWWGEYTAGPAVGNTMLVDQHNRLEWITGSGWTDGADAFRSWGSGWSFDLNDDFEVAITFHYDHTGTYYSDEGGIEMGLYWFDDPAATDPSHVFSISAENWVDDHTLENKNVFFNYMGVPGNQHVEWWDRSSADGMFHVQYTVSTDTLQFQTLEGGFPFWNIVEQQEYSNLRTDMGLTQLGIFFAGWSEGAGLASGNAYLGYFNVVKGTMTPEPLSSFLFVIGGGSLIAAHWRKKNRS